MLPSLSSHMTSFGGSVKQRAIAPHLSHAEPRIEKSSWRKVRGNAKYEDTLRREDDSKNLTEI
jgi:hypothetical protein